MISPVNQNPWISPVITVSKKTMEITERITGDLRKGQLSSHAFPRAPILRGLAPLPAASSPAPPSLQLRCGCAERSNYPPRLHTSSEQLEGFQTHSSSSAADKSSNAHKTHTRRRPIQTRTMSRRWLG